MPNNKQPSDLIKVLNDILELELAGVIRYLHYSLMVRGPGRIPIVKFFNDQANEALSHASIIGNKITAFGGHPSLKVKSVPETKTHAVQDILMESLEFERQAIQMYRKLLSMCGDDVALEELAREFIRLEQEHVEEVEKMLLAKGQ